MSRTFTINSVAIGAANGLNQVSNQALDLVALRVRGILRVNPSLARSRPAIRATLALAGPGLNVPAQVGPPPTPAINTGIMQNLTFTVVLPGSPLFHVNGWLPRITPANLNALKARFRRRVRVLLHNYDYDALAGRLGVNTLEQLVRFTALTLIVTITPGAGRLRGGMMDEGDGDWSEMECFNSPMCLCMACEITYADDIDGTLI